MQTHPKPNGEPDESRFAYKALDCLPEDFSNLDLSLIKRALLIASDANLEGHGRHFSGLLQRITNREEKLAWARSMLEESRGSCPECAGEGANAVDVVACYEAGVAEARVERAMDQAYLSKDAPSVPDGG